MRKRSIRVFIALIAVIVLTVTAFLFASCKNGKKDRERKYLEKGATTHVFVGHDHVNDYSVNYRGVTLTYGVKSSRQIYYDENMIGGTLISIATDGTVSIERKYIV